MEWCKTIPYEGLMKRDGMATLLFTDYHSKYFYKVQYEVYSLPNKKE